MHKPFFLRIEAGNIWKCHLPKLLACIHICISKSAAATKIFNTRKKSKSMLIHFIQY